MYAQINGARIYFDIEGEGHLVPRGSEMQERPVLFLIHGGPGVDHSYFRPWMSPLAEHFQLVYMDNRGNGRSEYTGHETYNMEQMSDDIDGLRRYLGLEKINLLGHSFGGMLALTYVLKYPETLHKLVVAASAPSYDFWEEAQSIAMSRGTEDQKEIVKNLFESNITNQADHDAWWQVCMPLYFHQPDEKMRELIRIELGRTVGAYDVSNYMMANEMPHYDVRPRLGEVTVPTLVLGGQYDWVTPPSQSKAIASGIAGSQLVIQDDVAHMGFAEAQDSYIKVLEDFLVD